MQKYVQMGKCFTEIQFSNKRIDERDKMAGSTGRKNRNDGRKNKLN